MSIAKDIVTCGSQNIKGALVRSSKLKKNEMNDKFDTYPIYISLNLFLVCFMHRVMESLYYITCIDKEAWIE